MKFAKFILLFFTFHTFTNLMGQTIVTNILFEEANNVFLGVVEKISTVYMDSEKTEYTIQVQAKKFYKGVHYDVGAIFQLRAHRPMIIDTVQNEMYAEEEFLVKVGGMYVFFIEKPQPASREESLLFADLADRAIEGIPYSIAFEESIKDFDKVSWIEANHHGNTALKMMFQGADMVTIATVEDIKSKKKTPGFEVKLKTTDGHKIILHLKDNHCISADGKLAIHHNYIFFLNQFEGDQYTTADRWLGIMDLTPLTMNYISRSRL